MNKKYIAPESKVMEMNAEGVLCASEVFTATEKPQSGNQGASIQIWGNQDVAW